jgi:hypothetical protein
MAIQLQQSDSTAIDGAIAACSTLTLGSGPVALQATQGGAAGSNSNTITVAGNASQVAYVFFETAANEPGLTSWQSGTYTMRLNLTAGNALQLTWDALYICRVSSSGVSQATIASATLMNIAMSLGVHSKSLTGSAQTASVGDRLYFVLGFSTNSGLALNFSFKADQLIDTPLVASSATFISQPLKIGSGQILKSGGPNKLRLS